MSSKIEHPGRIVVETCLKQRDLTVKEAAELLGVARNTLSRLVNGRHGISAEMALRLSSVFGREPEDWMKLQSDYDLARARKSIEMAGSRLSVRRSRPMQPSEDKDPEIISASTGISAVWPVTQDAWAFTGKSNAESRLSRNTVSLFRREGAVPVGWRVRPRGIRESPGDR